MKISACVLLLASFAVVGVATLMAATAHTPNQLFAWRLLTGIGLGASLPNALALTAEFAPTRNRSHVSRQPYGLASNVRSVI